MFIQVLKKSRPAGAEMQVTPPPTTPRKSLILNECYTHSACTHENCRRRWLSEKNESPDRWNGSIASACGILLVPVNLTTRCPPAKEAWRPDYRLSRSAWRRR